MSSHQAVKHPFRMIKKSSDQFMTLVADRVLPSSAMFYTAMIAPLVVIPMSSSVKTLLMIVASNWIQWWALPALQSRQNEISNKQDAKADADHEVMTYLANASDSQDARLTSLESHLADIKELLSPVIRKRD
jgi:hypothetical protein